MNTRVDYQRINELAERLKQLSKEVEDQSISLYRESRSILSRTRSSYSESYVRAVVEDIESILQTINRQAAVVSDKMSKKSSTLKWAAGEYRKVEEKSKIKITKPWPMDALSRGWGPIRKEEYDRRMGSSKIGIGTWSGLFGAGGIAGIGGMNIGTATQGAKDIPWTMDALNRGWGPINKEEYDRRMRNSQVEPGIGSALFSIGGIASVGGLVSGGMTKDSVSDEEANKFWKQPDYFDVNWQQDEEKLYAALYELQMEIGEKGPIYLPEYYYRNENELITRNKFITLQKAISALTTGEWSHDMMNHLEAVQVKYDVYDRSPHYIDEKMIKAIIQNYESIPRVLKKFNNIGETAKLDERAAELMIGALGYASMIPKGKTPSAIEADLADAEIAAGNRALSENSGKGIATNQWIDEVGNIKWPPNRGFDGEPVIQTLKPGSRVDRYGYEGGTFVSPEGTPYGNRALAPGTNQKPYNVYEVIKPIDVQAGKIASWFGESGGGIQYEFNQPISKLIEQGILRRVGP